MNGAAFIVIAIFTLAAALAAATLRKLMHAALSFAVALVAVAALIVFTILLTRRDTGKDHGFNWAGAIIAVAVFGGLTWAILKTQSLVIVAPHTPALTVKRIGVALMTTYVWPLQCVGLLLTAALIGALILVLEEKP